MSKRKKRILLCNEASFLNTGFSTYGRELLTRLHNSGKYDIAELGVYANDEDPRYKEFPWKAYGNLPNPNIKEEAELYNSVPTYQFGEFKFDHVLLDFQPDIVIDIRDWWMHEFQERSTFRDLFQWAIMPTVDASPQNEQWISTYNNADAVFNYSEWGHDILKAQSGGAINCLGRASPSANEAYTPVSSKKVHKASMGLNPDCKIVGTVMRNQRRKLYPDLFKAFRKFLDLSKDPDVYLYCHTSYPDLGWDLPSLIQESGLGNKIITTYVCQSCKHCFPNFFQDAVAQCPSCGLNKAALSNVHNGCTYEQLSSIVNLFDLYIQYANSEGFGLPQVEAAACAVPVMSVDYSAMHSVVRKLGGVSLPPAALYLELETGCYRAVPDNDFTANKIHEFFKLPEKVRTKRGYEARAAFEKYYNWDQAAEKWMEYIDSTEIKPIEETWRSPLRIKQPSPQVPENMSPASQATFLIEHVLCEPQFLHTYMWTRLCKDLTYQTSTAQMHSDFYFNESCDVDAKRALTKFDVNDAYNMFVKMRQNRNAWEEKRGKLVGIIQ